MIDFTQAAYRFLNYMHSVKNASVHTIRNYTIDLNDFKCFMEEQEEGSKPSQKIRYQIVMASAQDPSAKSFKLDAISRYQLRGYLAFMTQEEVNRRTILRRLSSLKSFFRYALGQGWMEVNPLEEILRPKLDKKIPEFLNFEQVVHLFDQPDTSDYLGFRDRVIMELFYSSGIRVSELVGLDKSDLDLKNCRMRIRGKGKKERVIPMTRNAADWIQAYLDHDERMLDIDGHQAEEDPNAVFLNKLGTRLSPRSVDRKFVKYLRQSGLEGHITPHTIRHTIATHWLGNGMDLKTIQELLGHTALSTTTIYTQVPSALKQKAFKEAHPRATK